MKVALASRDAFRVRTRDRSRGRLSDINRRRRHLTSGQAKRASLDEEYAAELERLRAEAEGCARNGKGVDGSGGRGNKRNPGQRIDQGFFQSDNRNNASRANAKRAKFAGTNRQYITDADRILSSYPQVMDQIESGDLSIPEANALCKQLDAIAEADRPRAYAMVDQPGIPSKQAIGMQNTAARMDDQSRSELLADFESDDTKRQRIARV